MPWYKFKPLKSLVDEGKVEVCIAVQRDKKQASHMSRLSKVIPSINQKLFSFLSRNKSNTKCYSIHDLVANGTMPIVISVVNQDKIYDEIEDSVIEKLEAANLDYLVKFGFRTLAGRILSVSKKVFCYFVTAMKPNKDTDQHYIGSLPNNGRIA